MVEKQEKKKKVDQEAPNDQALKDQAPKEQDQKSGKNLEIELETLKKDQKIGKNLEIDLETLKKEYQILNVDQENQNLSTQDHLI